MRLLCRYVLTCLALVLGLLAAPLRAQTTYTTVVVFGDSLSDTGNIANLTQSQYKIRYPASNPLLGFNYTDGRFTDGVTTQPAASTAYTGVWIEQMVKLFGAGVAVKDSLDGGTNYAYGDATTGSGTTTESRTFLGTPISITLNNMGQQVATYLATSPSPNASTLYVLWGGANDLLNAAAAGQDPNAAARTAVTNELALVQQLMSAGGTNFLLPNLPPLGAFAAAQGPAAVTALNNASLLFAQGLATGVTGLKQAAMGKTLNIYQADVLTLFGQVAASPMSFGLGNISTAADTVTASPDTYLIWDGLHPTTTGHNFIAATAANLFTPLSTTTTALVAPGASLAGQKVTVTGAVTSSKAGSVPSGLLTLFDGTTVVGSGPLDATGKAQIVFTPTEAAGAAASLTAVYAGDIADSPSGSGAKSLPLLSSAVGTTVTLTASAATGSPQTAITFTATVAAAVSTYGVPTGTVTFSDGSTALGTGTLNGSGVATFTTSALGAGTHQITASYAAAGLFAGSTSAAVTETITAPGFTAQATPTSLTISRGGSGSVTLAVTLVGGFTGTVTPACGTLPAHFSCSIGAPTVSASTNTTSYTLTLATNAATATASLRPGAGPGALNAPPIWAAGFFLPGAAGLFGWGLRRRRRGGHGLLGSGAVLLLCVGLWGTTGCGDSGTNNNAAPGSYTVPVVFTATGSTTTVPAQTVNLAVTVQ